MDQPQLLAPGEGERVSKAVVIKVDRPEIVITESLYEPGQRGPDPHVHHHHADAFWVLEGRLAIALGPEREEVEAEAGSFALAPPDLVHSFRNPGPAHARFLNFHAPGMGFGEYLRSGFEAPFDQHDPPADGGRPVEEAIFHRPGEGERLELDASAGTLKAGGDDAIGSMALADLTVAPGSPGAPAQSDDHAMSSFYVLEGTLIVRVGDDERAAGPGSYAVVPPGNAYALSNSGDDPVRVLEVLAPGRARALLAR